MKNSDLKKLQKNLNSLNKAIKGNQMDILTAFNKKFMRKYTKYECLEDFIQAGGFPLNIQSIPKSDLDRYVSSTTKFNNWQQMIDIAVEESIKDAFNI